MVDGIHLGSIFRMELRRRRYWKTPPEQAWISPLANALRHAHIIYLLGDYFSTFQLFRDTGDRIFSISLLAAAETRPRLSFDPQGVYELAFNMMPIGDDAVFTELEDAVAVRRAGADRQWHGASSSRQTAAGCGAGHAAGRERIARGSAISPARMVGSPLSGGLDSRLVFAALHGQGVQPQLYVYGRRATRMW